jgi:acyl-CoA reductase-like NAD-dependent aldehyde dehydrogenase
MMIPYSMMTDEAGSAPRMLRSLAIRAHSLLNDPTYDHPTSHVRNEIHSVLQQIAHLERRFRSSSPNDIERWLSKVREMIEARRDELARVRPMVARSSR